MAGEVNECMCTVAQRQWTTFSPDYANFVYLSVYHANIWTSECKCNKFSHGKALELRIKPYVQYCETSGGAFCFLSATISPSDVQV